MLNKQVKPIWLSSYPKSGNTWVGLFLSVLIKQIELDINNSGFENIISARNIMDSTLGINSSLLPEKDYLSYRSALYHTWMQQFTDRDYLLFKVHDACKIDDMVLFPQHITRGVVYIMRNPFDMAASWANHSSISIEKAVSDICDPNARLAGNKRKLNIQISQYMGTWSNHVESWLSVHGDNMLVVKYEELLANGFVEFSKILDYIGLSFSKEEIEEAILKTSFKNIQDQEKITKFKAAPKIDRFFRAGKVGGWRNEITMEQANTIIDCNYDTLLKFNYIDEQRNILV
ncbi:hypothetical protein EZJ43_00925 [Pedobacter changchengzhani]|uniref:Sulfotransferase domain-containing protein n=1 Tax=Pedobacter changchengzhani TaxID=2529274 RepID=A0A4R5MPQ5_9SPHI|nr:sulfotransferase domain-containing protein [Pedobacter changchengzhani]TDG37688.1 hypothetical protein EZJ43_00925 [Pedobacter changchengzhani]